jgi:hypothetical protein
MRMEQQQQRSADHSPLCPDSINLIDKYNTRCVFFCDMEELPHKLRAVAEIFLDEVQSRLFARRQLRSGWRLLWREESFLYPERHTK